MAVHFRQTSAIKMFINVLNMGKKQLTIFILIQIIWA